MLLLALFVCSLQMVTMSDHPGVFPSNTMGHSVPQCSLSQIDQPGLSQMDSWIITTFSPNDAFTSSLALIHEPSSPLSFATQDDVMVTEPEVVGITQQVMTRQATSLPSEHHSAEYINQAQLDA